MTPEPHATVFYVGDLAASRDFYAGLLERQPVFQNAGFSLFALGNGNHLGLRARDNVVPAPEAQPGAAEFAFSLGSDSELDALHAEWSRRGYAIAQKPEKQPFGYTFTALDPDRHRLRVNVLNSGKDSK